MPGGAAGGAEESGRRARRIQGDRVETGEREAADARAFLVRHGARQRTTRELAVEDERAASSMWTASELRRSPSTMMPGWFSRDIQLPAYLPSFESIMMDKGRCQPSRSITPTQCPGRGSFRDSTFLDAPAQAAMASANTTLIFFIDCSL